MSTVLAFRKVTHRTKLGTKVGEREISSRTVVGKARPARKVVKPLTKGAVADAPATQHGLDKAMCGN
eukprot:2929255-Lingulodinium_polyedra.AAC.1